MLKYTIVVSLSFGIVSCNFKNKQERKKINNNSQHNTIVKDTLITYDIEGISAEGAECIASYRNGKVVKCSTNVYGETGQATIVYQFESNRIKVSETKYSYRKELENLKFDEDMRLDYKKSYLIDFKGNIIGQPIQVRTDIFQEIETTVRFELK